MILSFGKHCRSGFICNPLWHVLLQYLCHILSIWEKTWQCHIQISELSPCDVPGAAALQTEGAVRGCREQKGACHVLAVVDNLLCHPLWAYGKWRWEKMIPDYGRTPSVVFFSAFCCFNWFPVNFTDFVFGRKTSPSWSFSLIARICFFCFNCDRNQVITYL